jgi:tetratricopeptide (TPR) repeat protein
MNDTALLYAKALQALARDESQRAIDLCREILTHEPGHVGAVQLMTEAERRLHGGEPPPRTPPSAAGRASAAPDSLAATPEWTPASQSADRAAAAGPVQDPRVAEWFAEGEAAFARGDWAEAVDAYLWVLNAAPRHPEAARRLAEARRRREVAASLARVRAALAGGREADALKVLQDLAAMEDLQQLTAAARARLEAAEPPRVPPAATAPDARDLPPPRAPATGTPPAAVGGKEPLAAKPPTNSARGPSGVREGMEQARDALEAGRQDDAIRLLEQMAETAEWQRLTDANRGRLGASQPAPEATAAAPTSPSPGGGTEPAARAIPAPTAVNGLAPAEGGLGAGRPEAAGRHAPDLPEVDDLERLMVATRARLNAAPPGEPAPAESRESAPSATAEPSALEVVVAEASVASPDAPPPARPEPAAAPSKSPAVAAAPPVPEEPSAAAPPAAPAATSTAAPAKPKSASAVGAAPRRRGRGSRLVLAMVVLVLAVVAWLGIARWRDFVSAATISPTGGPGVPAAVADGPAPAAAPAASRASELYAQCRSAVAAGQWSEATEVCEQVRDSGATFPGLASALATTYAAVGEQTLLAGGAPNEALGHFEAALALIPEDADLQQYRDWTQALVDGRAAIDAGQWATAAEKLEPLRAWAPETLQAFAAEQVPPLLYATRLGWGEAALAAGNHGEAERWCGQAANLGTGKPEAEACLAKVRAARAVANPPPAAPAAAPAASAAPPPAQPPAARPAQPPAAPAAPAPAARAAPPPVAAPAAPRPPVAQPAPQSAPAARPRASQPADPATAPVAPAPQRPGGFSPVY